MAEKNKKLLEQFPKLLQDKKTTEDQVLGVLRGCFNEISIMKCSSSLNTGFFFKCKVHQTEWLTLQRKGVYETFAGTASQVLGCITSSDPKKRKKAKKFVKEQTPCVPKLLKCGHFVCLKKYLSCYADGKEVGCIAECGILEDPKNNSEDLAGCWDGFFNMHQAVQVMVEYTNDKLFKFVKAFLNDFCKIALKADIKLDPSSDSGDSGTCTDESASMNSSALNKAIENCKTRTAEISKQTSYSFGDHIIRTTVTTPPNEIISVYDDEESEHEINTASKDNTKNVTVQKKKKKKNESEDEYDMITLRKIPRM